MVQYFLPEATGFFFLAHGPLRVSAIKPDVFVFPDAFRRLGQKPGHPIPGSPGQTGRQAFILCPRQGIRPPAPLQACGRCGGFRTDDGGIAPVLGLPVFPEGFQSHGQDP